MCRARRSGEAASSPTIAYSASSGEPGPIADQRPVRREHEPLNLDLAVRAGQLSRAVNSPRSSPAGSLQLIAPMLERWPKPKMSPATLVHPRLRPTPLAVRELRSGVAGAESACDDEERAGDHGALHVRPLASSGSGTTTNSSGVLVRADRSCPRRFELGRCGLRLLRTSRADPPRAAALMPGAHLARATRCSPTAAARIQEPETTSARPVRAVRARIAEPLASRRSAGASKASASEVTTSPSGRVPSSWVRKVAVNPSTPEKGIPIVVVRLAAYRPSRSDRARRRSMSARALDEREPPAR